MTHLLKYFEKLQEVCKHCEVFSLALPGAAPEKGMERLLEVVKSLKLCGNLSSNASNDSAAKASREKAVSAVKEFAEALAQHYVKKEVCPWLSEQTETLARARILSKPPGWAILTLNVTLEPVIGVKIQCIEDLATFMKATAFVSVCVDELLRMSGRLGPENARQVSVRLCTAFKQFKEAKQSVLVSFSSAFDSIEGLEKGVQALLESSCMSMWNDAMVKPQTIVVDLVNKQFVENHVDPSELKEALTAVSDASLLATGLEGLGCQIAEATSFVEGLLKVLQPKPTSMNAARGMMNLFKTHKIIPENAVLSRTLTFEPGRLQ